MFPLESFDESCIILETLYPIHFKDCAYVVYNVSTRDQLVEHKHRDLINEFVCHDVELYRMAQAFLDSLINKHFPEAGSMENALDNFVKRCEKQRRKNQLQSLLLPVYLKMRGVLA